MSDRMITAGNIQYEPQQLKVAFVAPRTLILIAGDYTVHSHAVATVFEQLRGNEKPRPLDVARMYGVAIQGIQRRRAEDLFLAPLGLNTDSFMAQQKELSEAFVSSLTAQMQDFEGYDVAALIVGLDDHVAHIYSINHRGVVDCADDVGFAAIGVGAWHANSRLMQIGYVNRLNYAPALAAIYAAKRAAEIAPGVGKATDIHLIFKEHWIPMWPATAQKLTEVYAKYEKARSNLELSIVQELQEFINDPKNSRQEPQTAESLVATTPEIARAIPSRDSGAAGSGAQKSTEHPSDETG